MNEFKTGDRVVDTSFGVPHEGVAGTIVQADWYPSTTHKLNPGVTDHGVWHLVIILDTAERLTVSNPHTWVSEADYITGSYIPF